MKNNYQVQFKENNKGSIITPFSHKCYGKDEILEVSFNELYKGSFSFARYGILQFLIKTDNVKDAVKLAKKRLDAIFKNGYPTKNDIVVFSGFKYDEKDNKKIPYQLSFMENTHHQNQFTKSSFIVKVGDLLKYDCDGDGWGFWYAVDENGKRISARLKGSIFIGYCSDGVLTKYK